MEKLTTCSNITSNPVSKVAKTAAAAVAAFGMVLALQGPVTAQQAEPSADAPAQFACDPGFYQVISGQLAEFSPSTGVYTNIGVDHSNYNAIGYRIADGLMYGVQGKNLIRIDATGTVETLGELDVPKGGSYTGDFGDDGLLHISRGGRDWHTVNVDTLETTALSTISDYTAVADIANVHGNFYGIASNGNLYRYDPAAGFSTVVGQVAGLPETLKAYGAAWSTAGGNLYIGRNSGEIYQITGYTTSNPVATQVGSATPTNSNDGSSCSLAPTPAGLNDVDGPTSESEPQTPEAIKAAEEYEENYETISEDYEEFTPEPEPEPADPEPESTPPVTQGETPDGEVQDAGLGQGPGCLQQDAEDMNPRDNTAVNVDVASASVVYEDGFGNTIPSEFEFLSGDWSIANGVLKQTDDCGYDLAAILPELTLSHFVWEAEITDLAGSNQGGLLIHQSTAHTRSGATVIDFTNGGSSLRWGYYDKLGYYVNQGTVDNVGFVAGEAQQLKVEANGNQVSVSVNGSELANFTSVSSQGMVGLVSSASAVSFDNVTLTALPAS